MYICSGKCALQYIFGALYILYPLADKIMKTISTVLFLVVLSFATAYAQPVVVSEYFSTASTTGVGEWTEIVVLDDNVDLRNYTLIDNNSAQTQAQGGVRFRNVSFWQHMRKGTIIVVRHRDEAMGEDTDAWDGYLEIETSNAMYFEHVQLANLSLPWESVALNIASGGDILELIDPSGNHVHSLSHKLSTGTYYNSMSVPKPNYGGSLTDNSSVAIVPGADISAYSDNNAATEQTSPTKGLPNASQNSTLWRSLREPAQLSNTSVTVTPNAAFTIINLSWTAVDDSYAFDDVTGYIILRSLTNTFTTPNDGVTYNPGAIFGSAIVVDNVLGSGNTTFSDDVSALGIPCNQKVYYRIYPFRYGTDVNGSGYNPARGRAYNTANFASGNVEKVFIGQATVTVNGQTTFCEGENTQLKATPAGASYQWFRNGNPVGGATADTYEATAAGGYTVQITAANGCNSTSITVATITVNPKPVTAIASVAAQCLRNNSFSFSQTGVAGATYLWEFGSDASPTTSVQKDPIGISFSTPGTKTVRLTATKDGCTYTTTQTVKVNPSPSLTISPVVPICEGDSTRLVATAAAGVTYMWSGNGLSDYTIANPWAKPTQTTLYTLVITDPVSGCTAQQQITVLVFPRPHVRIQANGPVTLCTGATVTLSDDGTSEGGQFTWLPDYQTGPVLTVTHDKPGVYIYRVVLVGGNGCSDTSNAIAISILPKPDAFINTPQGTTVCRGKTVRLSANDLPGATYKWGGGQDTREIEVGPGTYRVSVKLGDGCEAISAPVTVTELAPSFSLSTRTVTFGELGKCESNTETTIVLTNTGKEDLSFMSTASPHFVAPGSFIIPRNGSKTLTLRFAPTDGAGTYQGRIYLTASPCGVIDSIDVEGTKVGASDAKLDISSVAYPTRLFCSTETQDTSVTFTNVGTEELRITSVSVAAPFAIVSHTPADFPLLLQPGTTRQFTFRFAPSVIGAAQRDAVLRYETGTCKDSLLVSLSGLYEQPALASAQSLLQFAPLPGCEDHRDSTVVITNTGSVAITVDASFDPPGEFSVQKHSSQVLAPGESDTILVRFQPSGSGLRQANMQVRELLCNTVQEIAMQGVKQGISFAVTSDISFAPLVTPCAVGSTTAVLTISNTSEEQANGSVVSAVLKNASSGFQVSIPSGTALPNGETQSFAVSFTPSSDGVFADTLLLHLEPCDIIKMIPLSGVRGRAQLNKTGTEIALAPQPVGNAINASMIFRNTGTVPVSVTSIEGITAPFALLDVRPVLPALVQPDSTLTIEVKYTADNSIADTIHVYAVYSTPGCILLSDSTRVIGNGISSSVPLPVDIIASLPVLTGSPGDEIIFPLILNSAGLDTAQVSGVRAYLSFDGTMLLPLSVAAGPIAPGFSTTMEEPQPGHLRVSLRSTSTVLVGPGTAAGLHFRVLLGSALTTPITIDSLEFDTPMEIRYSKSSGTFILTDSCTIQTRLLNVGGATALAVVSSDEGSTIAEFSTAYDGPVVLALYDALGRQTTIPLSGEVRAGVYRIAIPTTALPEGMYFLVLQAAGITKTTGMPVVR